MKRTMVSGVLCKRGRASCQTQWRRGGAPEELASHANVDVVPAERSACAGIEPGASRTESFAHALHAAARRRGSDGDAERRQKEAASRRNSTGWQRLRPMRPRQERQLAKERSTKKARERAQRCEGVSSAVGCKRARERVCGLLEGMSSRSPRHWEWGAAPNTYTP